jgi:hypothetical protein
METLLRASAYILGATGPAYQLRSITSTLLSGNPFLPEHGSSLCHACPAPPAAPQTPSSHVANFLIAEIRISEHEHELATVAGITIDYGVELACLSPRSHGSSGRCLNITSTIHMLMNSQVNGPSTSTPCFMTWFLPVHFCFSTSTHVNSQVNSEFYPGTELFKHLNHKSSVASVIYESRLIGLSAISIYGA